MGNTHEDDRNAAVGELKTKGLEQFLSGNYLEAIGEYNKALSLPGMASTDDEVFLRLYKADAILKIGQVIEENNPNDVNIKNTYKSAYDECTKAVLLKPDYAEAYLMRGQILKRQKFIEEAIKDFEIVQRINPNNREAQMA